ALGRVEAEDQLAELTGHRRGGNEARHLVRVGDHLAELRVEELEADRVLLPQLELLDVGARPREVLGALLQAALEHERRFGFLRRQGLRLHHASFPLSGCTLIHTLRYSSTQISRPGGTTIVV